MKMLVKKVVENDDGSLTLDVDCDVEFTQTALNFYLSHIVKAALDTDNKEYEIKTEDSVED